MRVEFESEAGGLKTETDYSSHVVEVETERLLMRKYTKERRRASGNRQRPLFRTHFPTQYLPTRDGGSSASGASSNMCTSSATASGCWN